MTTVLHPCKLWGTTPAEGIRTVRQWWRGLPPISHILVEACSYLSIWNLVLVHFRETVPAATVLYTSLFCGVGGFYLAWVHPRRLYIPYLHIQLNFWETVLMDLAAHQFPRYLVGRLPQNPKTLFIPRSVVFGYLLWFGLDDIKRRYDLRVADMLLILSVTEFLFFL